MSNYIAQKEVPDLVIDGIYLDTLNEFELFTKNKNIDVVASIVVLPKELKQKLTSGALVNTKVAIREMVRDYEGNDTILETSFMIRDCEFSYTLTSDNEPTRYNLVLRNYIND